MIISHVYLLVRCLLGCLTVLRAGRRDRRALITAAQIHSRLPAAEAEDYMWGFPAQQLRRYESRTFTLTGDLDRATEARTEALRLYPASDQVDRVLLLLDAAARALAAGEPDQAASTAAQAMAAGPPNAAPIWSAAGPPT